MKKEDIELMEENNSNITVVEKETFLDKVKSNKVMKPILATVGIGILTVGAFILGRNTGHSEDEEDCGFEVIDLNDDASEE